MHKIKTILPIGITAYTAGVEIAFLSRDRYVLNTIICRKKKNKLEPVLQKFNLSFEELKPLLKNASALHLTITGKTIISRRISSNLDTNAEVVRHILPDAETTDFVAQYQCLPGMQFGALIRKDIYASLLEQFSNARLFPDSVTLGPHILELFTLATGIKDDSIDTLTYLVTYDGNTIAGITDKTYTETTVIPEPKIIISGNDEVNAYCIPSLCACINAEIGYLKIPASDDEQTAKLVSEAKQKRRFKRMITLLVPFIFVIVTANFFFNQHLNNKRNKYDELLTLNHQELAEINKLEKDIEGKKNLLGKRTGSQGPVLSIIGDQLAATVPQKIQLKNLEIFPLSGKIQKEKPLNFSWHKVLVEGISAESEVLDTWIKKCREMTWVKQVLLVKYDYDPEKKGMFKMEIILQ